MQLINWKKIQTDNIVLDIVGRESAVVKGLDVKDSEEKMTSQGLEEEEEEEKIETKIMPPGTSAAGSTFRGGSTPNLGGKGGKVGKKLTFMSKIHKNII